MSKDGGQPEGIVNDPNELDLKPATKMLVIDIHRKLEDQYPGFTWGIQANDHPGFGGIVNVFCLDLHTELGYTLLIVDVQDDPSRKAAITAGAEILDRFGWTHRKFGKRTFDPDFHRGLPKNHLGQCMVVDLGDTRERVSKTKKVQAEIRAAVARGKATKHVMPDGSTYVSVEK